MARLLQVFGFLSVLFRGATLSFQSLTIGGIVFLLLVARGFASEGEELERASLRWIRRFAIALAVMQAAYVAGECLILMQSADMGMGEVVSANFAIAGGLAI